MSKLTISTLVTASALAITLPLCWFKGEPCATEAPADTAIEAPSQPADVASEVCFTGRVIEATSGWSGSVLAYVSSDLRQEIIYGREHDPADPTHLVILNYSPWHGFDITREPTEIREFSASFEITCARAKTRDYFYVCGLAANGDEVLERWKKAPVGQVGGPESYVMQRRELYRGTALGGIKNIGVDHANRYLLLIHGQSPTKLSKMALPAGGSFATLYDSTQMSGLDMSPVSVFQRRHSVLGIIWTIEGVHDDGISEYVLLRDLTDDGTIDSWSTLTPNNYFAQYSVSAGVWQDAFLAD